MNYLAHLHLSPRDEQSMLGNLMGDFRKYLSGQPLPHRVSAGIENHLCVDRYTDSHPVVIRLKDLFSSGRRRYAGIIIDLAFDHFLSRNWHLYSDEDHDGFIHYSYECLAAGSDLMPARMRLVTHHMMREDWLGSYAGLAGIDWALNGMSRRMRFRNRLAGSAGEIEDNYPELEQGFLEFFPDLVEHVNWAQQLMSADGGSLDLNHDVGMEQGSNSQKRTGRLAFRGL